MAITFDPGKHARTLADRGLGFLAAQAVFAGPAYTFEDVRADYGEARFITVGSLSDRMVIIGWTPRGADRHVFTMRKANGREQSKYGPLLR